MDELEVQEHQQQELRELVARAADLCLKPLRHAVRYSGSSADAAAQAGAAAQADAAAQARDCCLLIEARDQDGLRFPAGDLELEIYRSGQGLNLMLARLGDEQAPLLWHGSHAVWMQAANGERCDRPPDGAPLEALCRRLRALLVVSGASV